MKRGKKYSFVDWDLDKRQLKKICQLFFKNNEYLNDTRTKKRLNILRRVVLERAGRSWRIEMVG